MTHLLSPAPYFERQISIQVIERLMALIEVLAQSNHPLTLKELAEKTQLHPSTVHRILNDLCQGRYVKRIDAGKYELGMRWLELGQLVKERINVRDVAIDYMHTLQRATGQTINLSIRQGDEIVYIERCHSHNSGMRVVRAIGGRAPLHLTSTGKLFLASDDVRQIGSYALRTQLRASTKNSITSIAQLEQELKRVQRQGYAEDNEELELGVSCIAAGIYDHSDQLLAGLSISAPSDRLESEWVDLLKNTAKQISMVLGQSN